MSAVAAEAIEVQFGLVRVYESEGSVWMEAEHDHDPADVRETLAYAAQCGWRPVPESEEEAEVTDDGVRIRLRKTPYGLAVVA